MGEIFTALFYQPIYNTIVILYRLLGDNLGLAIIAIALLTRLITMPLTIRQVKMTDKNKEMMEKIDKVKKKYKKNKEKQQQEVMKIQSEYLPGQIGGCLPLILQIIFFIYIYRVIRNMIDGASSFNDIAYSFVDKFPEGYIFNDSFLGGILHLKQTPSSLSSEGILEFLPYIILVILVGISQYASMKVLRSMRKKDSDKDKKKDKKKKKKDDKNEPDDFGEIMQQSTEQAMMIMPFMLMFGAFSFPAGLSVYWVFQSVFLVIQQVFVKRVIFKDKNN